MRFCSMARRLSQDTICHFENEIHFQRGPGAARRGIQSKVPMSTLAEISIPTSRRRPISRILLWFLLALAIFLGCALGYAYYTAHAALPQLDGRLQIAGPGAPVTVTRDGHGVPTIEAANLTDVFFAQ